MDLTKRKAEAIQTRQVEVLESQRYVDPIRYMTFMERINKTLHDYQEERDGGKIPISDGKKWLRITGLAAARWNTRKTSWMIVMQNRFYGAVCAGIQKISGRAGDRALRIVG